MSGSHRIRHRLVAAIATASAALALASTAEAIDLRDWGRKFPASERFVVLAQFSNQAVLDKETQLVWQAVTNSTSLAKATWVNAQLLCHNAFTGGRRGWRLPTYPEIASLFGSDGKPPAFNGVPNDDYWTASAYPGNDGQALIISLPTGNPAGQPNIGSLFRFWCVRGPA